MYLLIRKTCVNLSAHVQPVYELHTFVSGEKYKSHKTLKQIITSPFSNSIIEDILTE